MNRAIRLGLVLAGALAPACRMAPTYERPKEPLPAAYAGQAAQPAPGASFADLPWFELFQDQVLQQLILAGLQANADVQLAANRVLQTAAQVGIAKSYESPSATSNLGATRGIDPSTRALFGSNATPSNQYVVNMGISWELDFWGKLRSQTEVARAQFLASRENQNLVIQGLVTSIAQAYFQLRELDAELDLARSTLGSRWQSLQLIQLRREGGVSSMSDVNQAQSLVQSASVVIPMLEQQIAQQEGAIDVLLGRYGDPVPRGLPLDDQRLTVSVPPGLPSDLLERRPDVRMAEQQLVAANAQIGVAKAELFPSIQLTAGNGYASSGLSSLVGPGSKIWNVGAGVTAPIFNAGRLRTEVRLSELQQQQMVLQYAKAVQQAFNDAATSLVSVQKTRETRIQQQDLTATLDKQVDLANQRFMGGVAAYLEVQDAERAAFDGERNLVQAKRDELLAVLALYKALGGGWTPEGGS